MKVKVISRSTDEFTRERSQDLQVAPNFTIFFLSYSSSIKFTNFDLHFHNQRVYHNYDPNLRPQEKAVEYVRALTAAKLEKVKSDTYIEFFSV